MNLSWPDVAPNLDAAVWPTDEDNSGEDHVRQCRTVNVGSMVTLVFENRQTLWFRIQELAWFARLSRSQTPKTTFDWYEQLLPSTGRVTAAVCVGAKGRRLLRQDEIIRKAVSLGRILLKSSAGVEVHAEFLPMATGLAQWVEFRFSPEQLEAFQDASQSWTIQVEAIGYHAESDPLREAVKTSLLDDVV